MLYIDCNPNFLLYEWLARSIFVFQLNNFFSDVSFNGASLPPAYSVSILPNFTCIQIFTCDCNLQKVQWAIWPTHTYAANERKKLQLSQTCYAHIYTRRYVYINFELATSILAKSNLPHVQMNIDFISFSPVDSLKCWCIHD